MMLTVPQATLLRAIDAGNVADRRHARLGWATRRTDACYDRIGGGLGLNVTRAARRLQDLGLAEPTGRTQPSDDRPWRITVHGRLALAADAARSEQR